MAAFAFWPQTPTGFPVSAPVNIRPATTDDLSAMVELLRQLTKVERDFPFDANKQRRGLELLLERPRALVLVADISGMIAGMATLQELVSTVEGGLVGRVEDVVVYRAFRGRGVGTALIECLGEVAKMRGYHRLQLLADQSNTEGESFYATQGWEPTQLRQWRWYPEPEETPPSDYVI